MDYGEGLYALIGKKMREKFLPAHSHTDFSRKDVLEFFQWNTYGNVLGEDGKPIDKTELRAELSKFLDNSTSGRNPLLKRIGRRGLFRVVDIDLEEMDWRKTDAPTLDLSWPFQLEKYALLYPGNIACIAGTSNAGKSAFCHSFIAQNLNKWECHLFTSDMSEEELADRLRPLEINEGASFHAHPRSGDFADVLKPDCLNVVDYVEYVEAVHEVKEEIEQMHRRMMGGRGVLLIAIQKKFNQKNMKGEMVKRDLGYGAETTLSRPKLYLTLNPNSLKILKAKKRTDPKVNPNGLAWTFQLVGGAKFVNILKDDDNPF